MLNTTKNIFLQKAIVQIVGSTWKSKDCMIDSECCTSSYSNFLIKALYYPFRKQTTLNSMKKGTLMIISISIAGYWKLVTGKLLLIFILFHKRFFQDKNIPENGKIQAHLFLICGENQNDSLKFLISEFLYLQV